MRRLPRLAADPGRIVANRGTAVGELKMALFHAPEAWCNEPTLLLAASTPRPGWNRQHVEINHAGRTQIVSTPPRKSILGYAATCLEDDFTQGAVEITLHDADQWLVSCSDADLSLGDNLAILGNEIVQFGEATSLGAGRFRLGRLRRHGAGVQGAIVMHAEGEPFVLIEEGTLQLLMLPTWLSGSPVRASSPDRTSHCTLIAAFDGGSRRQRLEALTSD